MSDWAVIRVGYRRVPVRPQEGDTYKKPGDPVSTFHDCCAAILMELPAGKNAYFDAAREYALAGLEAEECQTEDGARLQALYILANLQYWRGQRAKEIKAKLREVAGR